MKAAVLGVVRGLVLGVVLGGSLGGCAQKPTAAPVSAALEGAQRLERRASIAYQAHDYAGAITAIQETLKREPRHFGALSGLGIILQEMGDEKRALDVLRRALVQPRQLRGLRVFALPVAPERQGAH